MASRKDDKEEFPFEFLLLIISALVMIGSGFLARIINKKPFTGLEENLKKASISKHDAMFRADKLEEAMNYEEVFPFGGTDEETIFNTFEGLNQYDFNLIYNAFGKRGYFVMGSQEFLNEDKDLIGWLRAELSSSDYQRIKDMFPFSTAL